jgi:hypothetical protein
MSLRMKEKDLKESSFSCSRLRKSPSEEGRKIQTAGKDLRVLGSYSFEGLSGFPPEASFDSSPLGGKTT